MSCSSSAGLRKAGRRRRRSCSRDLCRGTRSRGTGRRVGRARRSRRRRRTSPRGREARRTRWTRSGSIPPGAIASTSAPRPAASRTCLLQRGAARVIALDVGHGQLHPRLRDDPRVTVLERVNVRELRGAAVRAELATCDVSVISPADGAAAGARARRAGLGGGRAGEAAVRSRARGGAEGRRPRSGGVAAGAARGRARRCPAGGRWSRAS